jgi:hypothetical protein
MRYKIIFDGGMWDVMEGDKLIKSHMFKAEAEKHCDWLNKKDVDNKL